MFKRKLHLDPNFSETIFLIMSYWKLENGVEVDFILNDMEIAIECKAVQNIKSDHLKNLRLLQEEHPSLTSSPT